MEMMLKALGVDPKQAIEQLSGPLKQLTETMQRIDNRLAAIEQRMETLHNVVSHSGTSGSVDCLPAGECAEHGK
jgi:hypothetical protein